MDITPQRVAEAINAYMANWKTVSDGEDTPYRRARVAELRKIWEPGNPPIWLAHLEPHEVGMRDLPFVIAGATAHLASSMRYTAEELYVFVHTHTTEPATPQEGGKA